jgi:hypothetical protein
VKRFREFRCRGLTRPTTGIAACCACAVKRDSSIELIDARAATRTTRTSCARGPAVTMELNGDDLRRDPLEGRKATLEMMLAKAGPGIRFNEHIEGEERLCFGTPASLASKALSRNGRAHLTAPAARPIGSK